MISREEAKEKSFFVENDDWCGNDNFYPLIDGKAIQTTK